MSLNDKEKTRYSRHIALPQFGIKNQEKLKNSSILVIGCGGLGAPLLQYLTAAGLGTIGAMDYDLIDESNLQRQVIFGTADIGKSKVQTAVLKMKALNPNVKFIEFNTRLNSENALDIFSDFDLIVDATDNFPTRYLINDACVLTDKPFVYGSIYQFEGQVSVFNYQGGPNYRDLFPTPPSPGMVPDCSEGGVLGVLPGIIGSIQASETIKILTGIGTMLSESLLLFDALNSSFRKINIQKLPQNPISGINKSITSLIDYEEFCGLKNDKSIAVHELKKWINEGTSFKLIDIREPQEHNVSNLGGELIPINEIENNLEKIPKDQTTILYCKSGQRSTAAINLLKNKYGYQKLINLEGGIMAWKNQIDPEMIIA